MQFRTGWLQAAQVGLGVLLLAACASTPTAPLDRSEGQGAVRDFTLSGRLALRQAARSDLLQMEWRHQGEDDRIVLSTPLGSQVLLLEERPGHVRLTLPDRAPVEAADDEALMQSLLGYSLPVRGLSDWVAGRIPAQGEPQEEGTGDARVLRFSQQGWNGSLQRWRQVGEGSLPGLITVARESLQLRLVVDQWTVQRGEP